MAEIKEPQKVLAFAGLIFVKEFNPELALEGFKELLGSVIKKSDVIPFIHTTYYNKEMGENLFRQWVLFEKFINPDLLIDLKHRANEIESKFLNENGGRKINIDPGLISLSNLVLASTKNYAHRIYLGKGIYAEITLIYKNQQFRPLEWTYPDYREEIALKFFDECRVILKRMLGSQMVE
ncbi:MAG: DUF4416 family protein [candidate division WOR-3 bacterium]|nr:DUF4416 family protein [candidate division WOR-3 bacterium]